VSIADQIKTGKTKGDSFALAAVLREFSPEERRFVADRLIVAGVDSATVTKALHFVTTGAEPFYRNRVFVGIMAGVSGAVLGVGACLLARRLPKAPIAGLGLGLSTEQHLDKIEASLPEVGRLVDEGYTAIRANQCGDAMHKYGHAEHTMGFLRAHRQSTRQPERFAGEIEQLDRDVGKLFRRIEQTCVRR
jgi:hypothetical protein